MAEHIVNLALIPGQEGPNVPVMQQGSTLEDGEAEMTGSHQEQGFAAAQEVMRWGEVLGWEIG